MLVELKNAMYSYIESDEAALLTSLKDGTFDNTSKHYSDEEIDEIRHSKGWKQRFGSFLRKRIHQASIIQDRLQRWIVAYENAQDSQGRPIFTRKTKKVATEQLKKVQYLSDPVGCQMYLEVPAGKKSIHGLSKWVSGRGESGLEKVHGLIAHLANTGSSEALAGTITLGGTSMYNVKCRYTMEVNQKRLKGEDDGIPGHFEYQPPFWDHSLLALLNGEAERRRLRRPFEKVTEIREDNGEVFGAEYLTQQLERNKTVGQNKDTWMCNCILCHPLLSNSDSSNNETHSDKVEMEVEVVKQQKQKKHPKAQKHI